MNAWLYGLRRRLRFEAFMWSERIRSMVRKKGSDTLPRLYLPANHRKAIKGTTTAMAWGGMVLAFIVLPQPINIATTVGLFVVERTLNRIVYRFPTMFVPAPIARELRDVGFDHLAVATVTNPSGHPSILFLGFPSCEAAEELFTTFAQWCGQSVEPRTIDDRDPGRVGLSVVFEDTSTYRVFAYRTLTAPVEHEAGAEAEDEDNSDEVQEILQVNLVRTRLFPVEGAWPAIYQAQRIFGHGEEYILAAARVVGGQVQRCEGLPNFRKRGLRIRARFQLKRREDPVEWSTYVIMDRDGPPQ